MKTLTWPRDSHGLFDYESKNLTKKNLKTINPGSSFKFSQSIGKIARDGNDIYLVKDTVSTGSTFLKS
jgi:hypothetical protein